MLGILGRDVDSIKHYLDCNSKWKDNEDYWNGDHG